MGFQEPPLVVGHRGAAGLAPENTLASFQRAVALGVHAVELDVQIHAGKLWVIHDATVDRTTNGRGPLVDLSEQQLRELDAGDGQAIPTLDEVLLALPDSVGVNVELKGAGTAAAVAEAVEGARQEVLVSSFDHRELRDFADIGVPDIKIAPLFHKWQEEVWDKAAAFNAWSVNWGVRVATPARLREARKRGLRVLVYTVNDLLKARSLIAAGAWGVFTDRPDVITPASLAGRSPGTDRSVDQ